MPKHLPGRSLRAACMPALLLALTVALPARGDVFLLKSGERLDGRILLEANGLLHLDTDDGLFIVTRAQIKKRVITDQTAPSANLGPLYSRLRALRAQHFDRGKSADMEERIAAGREQILAIHDPEAIGPLVKVLIDGKLPARDVLVEALDGFAEREATLFLISIAIADPAENIRAFAALALSRRTDAEVVRSLCRVLKDEDEVRLRHAAVALGAIRATDAVPDLIEALDTGRKFRVRHDAWSASTPESREITRLMMANSRTGQVDLPWRTPGKAG